MTDFEKINNDYLDKLFMMSQSEISRFEKDKNVMIFFRNHTIYVITSVGYWKIVPSNTEEKKLMLMHGNDSQKVKTDFVINQVIYGNYHLQKDIKPKNLMSLLNYIISHDVNTVCEDIHKLPQDTIEQKNYYKKTKNKQRKESIKRTINLLNSLNTY